jgi:hypothetical protein
MPQALTRNLLLHFCLTPQAQAYDARRSRIRRSLVKFDRCAKRPHPIRRMRAPCQMLQDCVDVLGDEIVALWQRLAKR